MRASQCSVRQARPPHRQASPPKRKSGAQQTAKFHAPGGGATSVAAAGVLDHERPAAVLDAAVPTRRGMVAGVAVAAAEDALAVPTNHTRAASNGHAKFHCARSGAAERGGKRENELLVLSRTTGLGAAAAAAVAPAQETVTAPAVAAAAARPGRAAPDLAA
jgi:hypothetical protein